MGLIMDAIIPSRVQLTLDEVVSLIKNGFGFSSVVKDDLEKIKSSLNNIRSVIPIAEERPLNDLPLGDWLEKLIDATYDADNVLDEYATVDLRRKVEANNSLSFRVPNTNKVRKIAPSLSIFPVLNPEKMDLKLKEIRKRLESIEKESHTFQLSEGVINCERESKEHRDTYGRDEDKVKIVNLLLLPVAGHEDENVSVIPIVGMGGLGKTTLAQLVFNDDQVQNHFELKMWVYVSDDFEVRRLMEKIIARATGSNPNVSDLDELQRRVRKALIGRRFLLVLEDVCIEEQEKWDRLGVLLMCGERGSRIIVTTCNPMIASMVSRIEPHCLKFLAEEDCWKLFTSRAFPDHRERDHPKLVEIGKNIVTKCGGVPLAVITLGSLLSFKREESEWVFVRDSELWNLAADDVHGVLPALRLSYYHLNPILRQCFLFCAIFPKNYNMDKELLIRLWMASGCVPSRTGMELEDIGIDILNELLTRSVFQEVKDGGGGDGLKVKVHDLVHDLAQSVMGNDCCIIESGKSVNISKRVRHLSFYQIISPGTPPDFFYEAQSLRTFLMLDSDFVVPRDLAIFKILRVLDLQCSHKLPLLTSLGELIHLRYFRLMYSPIRTLPESIGSLQNLQALKLYSCPNLWELPKGTRNLINLRCLDIDFCYSLSHMPAKIGMLSCLRKLPLFVVGNNECVCSGIEELQCLNLRGNLKIEHLERIAIPSNAQRANLIGKPDLDRLQLSWHIPNDDNDDLRKAGEEVLKGLQPHENLKELEIIGYGGIDFPSWMMDLSLPSIVKITLEDCRRCERLPQLGQLPSLKFLRIERMDSVVNIGSEFYANDMSEGFPSLEKLEIEGLSSLKVWSGLHSERVFPSLQILKISDCRDLNSLPEGIENLLSLKELSLENVGLTSLPRGIGNLSSLEVLKFQLESLTFLPESMQELSTLRQLVILSCPQLPSLPKWVENLTALQFLTIHDCPRMVSLPVGLQRLTRLQRLSITLCPEMQR